MERALGMDWCIDSDSLKFHAHVKITRYPLGLKLGIRTFWIPVFVHSSLKLTWDEEFPEDVSNRWFAWLSDLSQFASFSVRRCIKPECFGPVTSAQLNNFSDASEKGYGVVTCLHVENSHGRVHCSFLLGKARVTPLKSFTVPRFELTAATIAVKMDTLIK